MKKVLFIFLLLSVWLPNFAQSPFGKAQWIGAITSSDASDYLSRRSIYEQRSVNVKLNVASVDLWICGLGQYELTINGRKVGGAQEFAPIWSDYEKTIYYNHFKVNSFFNHGNNIINVLLGNGFYNVFGGGRYKKFQRTYGPPTLLFCLKIKYKNGKEQTIYSDNSWQYALSPITFNSIYGGEDYDARLEYPKAWHAVVRQNPPKGKLYLQKAPPVTIHSLYKVKVSHRLNDTTIVFDMGQNLAGFPLIKVKGKRGRRLTITMGEHIDKDGFVDQKQTGKPYYDKYILGGRGVVTWHPRFTYYGFRYIQVTGDISALQQIQSCFISNSVKDAATFECSNPIFNATHKLIYMAVRSNMQGIFTDCPHREKLGWLEQLNLNGPGLFFNYDLTKLMPKIMRDMADAQGEDGRMPNVAPHYVHFAGNFEESPEWGSSFIIIPFQYLYFYGDSSLIKEYYRQMARYVDYLSTRANNHILSFGLGDWYDYGDFRAGFSRNTPVPLMATAYYYMDIKYLMQAARIVGNIEDEKRFANLADTVKEAFNKTFFKADSAKYGTGSQSSYAMPLYLDMVEPSYRRTVLDNLVKDIHAHGDHLTTGEVGNRYMFKTLADNGLNELMYKMHNNYDAPGYGFQLKCGATTLTEQWNPEYGASWNHFMLGEIDEWFFSSLAGIGHDDDGQGFRHIVIRPHAVGDLTYVKASYKSNFGLIKVEWHRNNSQLTLKVGIPKGCSAKIYVPGEEHPHNVEGGDYIFIKK